MKELPTYRRIRLLGEGGQARVELAEDTATGQRVALKFPVSPTPAARDFFKAEVALLSRLSHPNLVKILDYRDDGPTLSEALPRLSTLSEALPRLSTLSEALPRLSTPYYVMEYVDGVAIDEALAESSFEEALVLFAAFCRGLHYLHVRGLLHRDLKPANVLVTSSGDLKLLDFGMGGIGTPAYMAPEALSGMASAAGDLYALGKIFSESANEHCPAYFQDLLKRLTDPDPALRPASAVSLIRYLNRHVAAPYAIDPEENILVSLQKPAWIARKEEGAFWKWIEAVEKQDRTALLRLTGPTGVGRSRFLEETSWKRKLAGRTWEVFGDLQQRDEADLRALAQKLQREQRKKGCRIFVLEYADDRISPALSRLLEETRGWEPAATIALEDLSPAQTRRLIDAATVEAPLPPAERDALADRSGGRPLLVIEALRQPGAAVPSNLSDAVAVRIKDLSPDEARLLAAVAAHPETASMEDALAVSESSALGLQDARLSLQTKGILAAPDADHPGLRLAHPSLREAYLEHLPSLLLRETHARWTKRLIENQGGKADSSPAAALITEHALAAADSEAVTAWGAAAVESLMNAGRLERALALCDNLLDFPPFANDSVQQYTWHGHRAPLLSRLGRYDEALAAYDHWRHFKADDGTGVEDVKHRLYTGMVHYAAGRNEKAGMLFTSCLRTGDSTRHAHHRPYHARAHFLLGTRGDLEAAANLAGGHPLLQGEIENQRGRLEQAGGNEEAARAHFENAVTSYREAGNPQAEAIAHNSLGMLLRETGDVARALEEMDTAVRLAESAGEPGQIHRYRLNRALLLLDLARYGEALKACEDARDAFDPDAEESRFLTELEDELTLLAGVRDDTQALESSLRRKTSKTAASRIVDGFCGLIEESSDDGAQAEERLGETIEAIKNAPFPEARAALYGQLAAALEKHGLFRLSRVLQRGRYKELKAVQQGLPEELKMDYENKRGLRSLEENLKDLAGSSAGPVAPVDHIPETRFRQFCEINRQIALKGDVTDILERVIDAAIEMTGAERGFLLLQTDGAKGPFPGYEVKTARRINRESLSTEEFQFSLTAVKETLKRGTHILTDDAQADPRFREKMSVVTYALKSMLAVPLEADGKVFGAVYLDHRYRPGRFSSQDVTLLDAFAVQASLAIQKARLVESLRSKVEKQKKEIETLSQELARSRDQLRYGYEDIVGQSPAIMKVFDVLDHVTETSIPVWIHGESGTGKELVARSLHLNSARKEGPFVAENVSTIPETLLESELFGHKKGSFTHADRDRVGLFEQADGGTLFLDEVADMPPAMQAKLLRVLQEGEVRPVGASKAVKIDVRLVSASNRDLNELVAAGKFRQDLFFRINGLTIKLPPLRERKEDIPLLASHLIRKISRESGLAASELEADALELLLKRDWPGNIRELESALRNALLFAKGRPVTRKLLASHEGIFQKTGEAPAAVSSGRREQDLAERRMIIEALRRNHLDKEKAAAEMGISLRNFYTRMDRHGIPKKKTVLAQFVGLK